MSRKDIYKIMCLFETVPFSILSEETESKN